MILNRILQYYQSLEEEFYMLYTSLLVETDKKNLHVLRLNAKKQIAFFNLVSYFDAGFRLKYVRKPFRQLLKTTGNYRDTNVALALIDTASVSSKDKTAYLKHFRQKELYHTALMKQNLERLSLLRARASSDLVLRQILSLEGRVDLWVVLNNYFIAQLDVIRQGVAAVLIAGNTQELHRLRMRIKELILNLQILQRILPKKLRLKKLYRHFDYLQSLLGEWHDCSILYQKIHREQKPGTKTLERDLKKSKKSIEDRIFFLLPSYSLFHAFALRIFHEIFTHPL